MVTKAQQAKIQQAITDLHITVPIYRVRALQHGGLRLWLYGHREPVDWAPEKRTRRRSSPEGRKPTKATT